MTKDRRAPRRPWSSHLDRRCRCGCKLGDHFPGAVFQPCANCPDCHNFEGP